MTEDQHRLFSSAVALGSAAVMAVAEGWRDGVALLAGSGLGLVLVWFADGLASFVGSVGLRRINRPSPPGLVRAMGWILLAVFALVAMSRLPLRMGL